MTWLLMSLFLLTGELNLGIDSRMNTTPVMVAVDNTMSEAVAADTVINEFYRRDCL